MLLAHVRPPRPNLRVYWGFSVCSLGFVFHLMCLCFSIYSHISFVILKTFTDMKWGKETGKKNLVLFKSGILQGKRSCTWLLKSPKTTHRNRSVFSVNISKMVSPCRQVTLIGSVCQKPNLNLPSFTTGSYTVVSDSGLKFWNGNYEAPVFVCLHMCYRCVALPKLICKGALFNWLNGN